MQLFCPHCKAQLSLPESAAGKKARCPACKHVFLVALEMRQEAETVQVPPPAPLPAVAKPPPLPAAEQSRASVELPPRRRRAQDEDDTADDRPRRRRRREDDEDRGRPVDPEQAHAKGRRAAYVLYAAATLYLFTIIVNTALSALAMLSVPLPPNIPNAPAFRVGQVIGAFSCGPSVHIIMAVFLYLAGSNLSKLRSQGLVITGIVICFVIVLFLTLGTLINVGGLVASRANLDRVSALTTITLNTLSTLVLLCGGIMSIVALIDPGVQALYASPRRR